MTSRGQTVIPAAIRERFALGPFDCLDWLVDGDGTIRVVSVMESPVQAFRGQGPDSGAASAAKPLAQSCCPCTAMASF